MSRLPVALLLAVSMPAGAQNSLDARVAERIAQAKEAYGAEAVRPECAAGDENEIVVCAPDQSGRWRVPSTIQENPGSRAARRTGMPSAPQLDRGSCKGQPGCVVGGWAPPPVYYIDLKAIPEAPEGSDADRVAKGEISER